MPKTKLRPRYEMKNVPEKAIKELRDYAEERGIDRGEAFGEAVAALKKSMRDPKTLEEAAFRADEEGVITGACVYCGNKLEIDGNNCSNCESRDLWTPKED